MTDAERVALLEEALFDLAWHVKQETEAHTWGKPAYDMTLDDLHEYAEVALQKRTAAWT